MIFIERNDKDTPRLRNLAERKREVLEKLDWDKSLADKITVVEIVGDRLLNVN